ncbi:2-dehydro-3-deoxygluconokinase [Hornefia porci]|uniref:2-dehydro-3-deoxygluconokinase n=1 Tax=Hornefia porci TaxID=2652292 RepID=A0A1Q9JIA1_9FIRM|nr:sugar kinase [Hornefia porci]OLR55952.1 2-dehydro-3-deoxygluconokinase [Hornefia porci]
MAEIITMGEPMVVLIPQEEGPFAEVGLFSKGAAGAELNVAIGASRLGHSVRYISRLGRDFLGEYLLEVMKREGLDVSAVSTETDRLTGFYFKTKVPSGDPQVFYMRKNSAASGLSPADVTPERLQGARFFHLTGITAAVSASCLQACRRAKVLAREQGLQVTFDPNLRPALWRSEEEMISSLNGLAEGCDYILPGVAEGRLLTGCDTLEGIADFYLERGVKAVIVKNRSEGAYYKTAAGECSRIPGFHVKRIVDTVGAGDAFSVGVLTGLTEGLPLSEAVRRGNAMGAIMITSAGDNDALPGREELIRFMEEAEV